MSRVRFSSQPGLTHTIPASNGISLEDLRRLPLPSEEAMRASCEMDLLTAASIGNVKMVEKCLGEGKNANEVNRSSWTPLLYAAQLDHKEVCQLLIDSGADVNLPNRKGQTPLMLASACGNTATAKILLGRKADVHARDRKERQALHIASSCSQQSLVNELLAHGADPNSPDADGMTPTLEACVAAHQQILTALLAKILEIIEAAPRSLTELLVRMGLEKYEEKLHEEKVDSLDVFFRLNDQDLTEMRIPYGPKKRMLAVIDHYERTKEIRVDVVEPSRVETSTLHSNPSGSQQEMTATLLLIAQENETCKRIALSAFEHKDDPSKLCELLPQILNSCDEIATRLARHPIN